jgi:ABC-2 type transport system permease protein
MAIIPTFIILCLVIYGFRFRLKETSIWEALLVLILIIIFNFWLFIEYSISTLSENQIVVLSLLCFMFLLYFWFEGLVTVLPTFSTISALGIQDHYKSMSRGVLDTRDIIYFISISVAFLSFTVYNLKSFKS